jgi:alkaline phosphatase
MRNINTLFILLALILTFTSCNKKINSDSLSEQVTLPQPKNIILLIGDGMGLTQITAGLYQNNNSLHLERFKNIGLHKSYSANKLITDSAAGATAFACGVKTYNGAIGVDKDTVAVKTLLEMAEERNMPTGLVATSTITHATPGSFISHQPSRKLQEAIAADFLNTEVDFFIGGGMNYFSSRETDERNIIEELEAKNYQIDNFFDTDLSDVKPDKNKNFGYFAANDSPLPKASGRNYLNQSTDLALEFLSSRSDKEGFFLMIEGSQIDWGGHANDSDYIITEMLDFDKTIGKVIDFAKKDGNTLVVVTADHETGGYAINPGSEMGEIIGAFTTDYHTAAMIPVFAYGPGSELFCGIYENTAIFDFIKTLKRFQ